MFENINYISGGKFISRGEWIHPDRIIDTFEIIFVIDGVVYINETGIEYQLQKNDILILEPDLRHFGYKKSVNTSFYWLHLANNTIKPRYKTTHIQNPYNLSLLFNQLLHYSVDNSFPECTDYISRLIFAEIFSANIKPTESKLANSMAEWIDSNNDVLVKVSDVAEHFGYNVDYLSRLFKKYYHKSLKEHIDDTKIQFIKNRILNSNTSLKQIASACGFEEYGYFLNITRVLPLQNFIIYIPKLTQIINKNTLFHRKS